MPAMPKKLFKGHVQEGSTSTVESSTTTSAGATSTANMSTRPSEDEANNTLPLPRLVIFDLDYTLWPFWVDTHVSPPLKATPDSDHTSVTDRIGDVYSFYDDVPAILAALPRAGIRTAVASRTCAPDLARDMLKLLHVPALQAGSQDAMAALRTLASGSRRRGSAVSLDELRQAKEGARVVRCSVGDLPR
jgi:magnesium-dependent phosphatase 1